MMLRPILFSGPMVMAILDGRKTQTRRLVRGCSSESGDVPRHYCETGDRLWVRECLAGGRLSTLRYAADRQMVLGADLEPTIWQRKWRHACEETIPSIHMPRWACRIELDVIDVRAENLVDISDADAVAEGITEYNTVTGGPRNAFAKLWDKINGKRAPWSSNPYVWRIEFRRAESNR